MRDFFIYTASDWSYEDIDYVREIRRQYANEEQNAEDKAERKYCQRMVKAATLVLEHMTGYKGGKWDAEPLRGTPHFPLELHPEIGRVFFLADEERIRKFNELSKTTPATD